METPLDFGCAKNGLSGAFELHEECVPYRLDFLTSVPREHASQESPVGFEHDKCLAFVCPRKGCVATMSVIMMATSFLRPSLIGVGESGAS